MRLAILALPAVLGLAACSSEPPDAESATPAVAEAGEGAAPPVAEDPDSVPAEQVADIPIERVEFDSGSTSVAIADAITGYETVDYVVRVAAGQPISVALDTSHTATYFNLIEPGETDVAIHVGSTSGNKFEGAAEKSGDYRIRVYMMRSAARREETADYSLAISVG